LDNADATTIETQPEMVLRTCTAAVGPPAPREPAPGTAPGTLSSAAPAPPAPGAAGQPLHVGTVLGKCLITARLGKGSSCQVFQALHQGLNIQVALKVLWLNGPGQNQQVYESLKCEARLLALLNHPHVVRVWDFVDDVHYPHLVLEYVEGLSLADLIRHSGRLSPDRAVQIITQVADGLAAAARMGVLHRDVKPGNILLHKEGQAKLVDFGHAALVLEHKTVQAFGTGASPQGSIGTPAYIAPEQCLGTAVADHRADIYSLGATFYHAVTGRMPFTGRTHHEMLFKQVQEQAVPPLELVPDLPPALSDVILTMMAKDPNDRYQTYEELLAALRQAHRPTRPASESVPSRAIPAPPNAPAAADDERVRLMEEAEAAVKAGNKVRALRPLLAYTELDAHNERAWLLLAGVAGSAAQAVAALEHALAVNPGNERTQADLCQARLRAGMAALQAGNKLEAQNYLLQVVKADPDNEQAWLGLAAAAELAYETAAALARVVAINPSNEQAGRWLAQHRARQGGAASPWRCPLCQAPADTPQGRCPSCQAVLSLADLDSLWANDRVDLAQVRQAIARYEGARQTRSEFASAYWLGLAHLNAKQLVPALRHLLVAMRLRPEYTVFGARVRALVERCRPRQASAEGGADHSPARASGESLSSLSN
jgi:tetratricopeptide (TPR) repeat protein